MAAPIGNQYATKARRWQGAIERALEKRSLVAQRDALEELADKLIAEAMAGERWAIEELGNRLDGRPAQALAVTGADEGPIRHEFAWAQSE
jgi:hypothetical protein